MRRPQHLTGRRLTYWHASSGTPPAGLRMVADFRAIDALVGAGHIDEVVILAGRRDDPIARAHADSLLARFADRPVSIRRAPDTLGDVGTGLATCAGLRLITALDRPLSPAARAGKRAIGLILRTVILTAAAPIMAVIFLLLVRSGPALFRQRRIGADGAPFEVLKFRTMTSADPHGPRQACAGDKRVTKLGTWLRRYSLDELQQLINVLRGEMSLVGPRPHAPETSTGEFTFEQAAELYGARHRVKPGLTGLAQVRRLRGPTASRADVAARIAADLDYTATWSPWLDLLILLRTLPAVFEGRNAC